MPVDERLIPINGLIALLRGDGGWPKPLGQQGFRRHQLEVPVSTPLGNIRVDALVYRREPDLIVLSEAKSGRNLERDQAKKYLAVDSSWLRRAGAIPPELRPVRDPAVCTLFVGREEHRSDLETGLEHLGISAPLLTVGSGRARLTGSSDVSGLDPFDESHHAGLPPARIPVDHQSSDEDLIDGDVALIEFPHHVEDLPALMANLFTCREPFRLWAVPQEVAAGQWEANAVDLHVGHTIRLEITSRWLRVLLGPHTCGNTLARLVANLQHRFDARIAVPLSSSA